MIHSKDRSRWFGASDTSVICGNWNTRTFEDWWLIKLGISKSEFETIQTKTGTALEHRILQAVGVKKVDRQIKIRPYRLRVNLDGETREEISEVKTHSSEVFKVTKAYWRQCQVEMFAANKQCRIVAYRLLPEDYQNWFLPIDESRLSFHPIEYDPMWIHQEYLPKLRYLASCLKRGVWPNADKQSEMAAGQ